MESPTPQAYQVSQAAWLADWAEGKIPHLTFFDHYTDRPDPEGGASGPLAPVRLWKALKDAQRFHIDNPGQIGPKLVYAQASARLRDARYARLGRRSLRKIAIREKLKTCIHGLSASSAVLPMSDLSTIRQDPTSATVETLKPSLANRP